MDFVIIDKIADQYMHDLLTGLGNGELLGRLEWKKDGGRKMMQVSSYLSSGK